MKIIFNKIYLKDEHIATIRFGQLITYVKDEEVIKKLEIEAFKLNLQLIIY